MNIPSNDHLIKELNQIFDETKSWIHAQSEERFNIELIPGKWTIAGHLYHLIKSTKAVSKGMSMPKIGLQTMFGKSNRKERTFKELQEKYENSLLEIDKIDFKDPNNFEAEPGRHFNKLELIKRFEQEQIDFIKAINKWDEEKMSIYILPHPLLGKCTIREFIYFTIFHTEHHLKILKEKYI